MAQFIEQVEPGGVEELLDQVKTQRRIHFVPSTDSLATTVDRSVLLAPSSESLFSRKDQKLNVPPGDLSIFREAVEGVSATG